MASKSATFRRFEHIKAPADFRRAFDRKRSVSDAALIVHGVENGLDHSRLGISVSRRRVPRASSRNRIKRLIREAFRLSKGDLPRGLDLVVVPRRADFSLEEVRRSLVALARDASRRLGSRRAPINEYRS